MWQNKNCLRYYSITPKLLLSGGALLSISMLIWLVDYTVNKLLKTLNLGYYVNLDKYVYITLAMGVIIIIIAVVEKITRSDARNIKYIVRNRLCSFKKGNPLKLHEGELEPIISVKNHNNGFRIRIESQASRFENISNLESVISDCLRGRYCNYAVIAKEEDISGIYVDYYIVNVKVDFEKQDVYRSKLDIPYKDITRLYIREDKYIDYTKVLNGSTLVVGGTRSGKTTGIISVFLLQTLKKKPDEYWSKVVIVDPKSAELSQCPHVLSPDLLGGVEHILEAVIDFNKTRIKRQDVINKKGRENGKVAKWFELGMKPCILFLDEWVSLVDLFPKKATKDKPLYCATEFISIIRQIATQGASAGCFLIISTAQASVGVGSLDSVINNACGIRIMFKPSREEARFVWDSKKTEVLKEWAFNPGDAWLTIDDGMNNNVAFVKFPYLDDGFDEYKILSDLLRRYYK